MWSSEAGRSENVHVSVSQFVTGCFLSILAAHLDRGRFEIGGIFDREIYLGFNGIHRIGLLNPKV